MPPITILYFGTNEFSARVLESLAASKQFTIVGVVTQPPRPIGREQKLTPSPVSTVASSLSIPLFEPENLKKFDSTLLPKANVFVVYAYGSLIPQSLLDQAPHGALNIHPSLLPRYRGPTPVQSAIMNGDEESGVSIILLDAQMDHGPIISQIKEAVTPDDTTDSLTAKLVKKVTPALIEAIPAWVAGTIKATTQNDAEATLCKILTRDDGKIDFTLPAQKIYNQFRALTPWPGVWALWNNQRIKLLKCVPSDQNNPPGKATEQGDNLLVGTGAGSLIVSELQLEGKKAMSAKVFINGYKTILGSVLN